MIKKICDACGREGSQNRYAFRKHLNNLNDGLGFVDQEGNHVSRVDIEVDLCNGCYNAVVMPSITKLKELQKENGIKPE